MTVRPFDTAVHGPVVAPYFDGTQPCATTDPELWFPDKGGAPTEAKRLCAGCEFRRPCLEHALTARVDGEPVQGVWGGTTARERARMRQGTGDRRRHPDRDDRILALHDEHLTSRQIADRLGIGVHIVQRVLRDHGRTAVQAPVQPRATMRPARRTAA